MDITFLLKAKVVEIVDDMMIVFFFTHTLWVNFLSYFDGVNEMFVVFDYMLSIENIEKIHFTLIESLVFFEKI